MKYIKKFESKNNLKKISKMEFEEKLDNDNIEFTQNDLRLIVTNFDFDFYVQYSEYKSIDPTIERKVNHINYKNFHYVYSIIIYKDENLKKNYDYIKLYKIEDDYYICFLYRKITDEYEYYLIDQVNELKFLLNSIF